MDPKLAKDFQIGGVSFQEVRIDQHLMDFENFNVNVGSLSK